MRINELNEQKLSSLLNELYGLAGAKEIFSKFDVEMVNKETETMGLKALLEAVKSLIETSKTVKEYTQAVQFLDLQINTNEAALKTAEGFMKTMVEGMLSSFKASKELAVNTQSGQFAQETKELVSNIVNEEDRKAVEKHLSTMRLDKVDEVLATIEKEITTSIDSRYKNEVKEEVKKETKKQATKEKAKEVVEEEKPKSKPVEEKVTTTTEDEIDEEVDNFDFDLDDEEEKPKPTEEKVEEPIEDIPDVDIDVDSEDIDKEIDDIDFADLDDDPLLSGDNTEIDFM